MRRHQLAVAGCGAAAFGLHLPVLAAHPGFEIIAVHDRDPHRARMAASQFAVPATATSRAALMDGADMLVVLTGVHDELIETALNAGVNVFTEKPVSLDLARTRELRAHADAAGLLLEVGAMRAHDPALHALLSALGGAPRGGWLIKSDGIDEPARSAILPAGFAPYTFAADPPQPVPADLEEPELTALRVLLWEGYHQLTALAIAAGPLVAVSCVLAGPEAAMHAAVADRAGHLFTIVIGRPPTGVFTDQIHLHTAERAARVSFPPPYTGATATLVPGDGPPTSGYADPFTCMWEAIHTHLSDGPPPGPHSDDVAEQVEELALRLAQLAVVTETTTPEPEVPSGPDRSIDHA